MAEQENGVSYFFSKFGGGQCIKGIFSSTNNSAMPSLVNELTPSQRLWLFENFPSGENDEPFLHPDVGLSSNQFPHDRRFSDAQLDPYRSAGHTPRQDDNRNSIFRLGAPPTPSTLDGLPSLRGMPASNEKPISPLRDPRDEMLHFEPRVPFPSLQPSIHRTLSQSPPEEKFKMGMVTGSTNKGDNFGKAPIYPHIGDKLTWEQSFQNLQVYKKTFGDCNVPQKYRGNPKLGGWVNKQRKKKKNPNKYGKLTDAQVRAMELLGFKWNVEHGVAPPS